MSELFIFILNEKKHVNSLRVDGISGKVYPFIWNPKVGFYTYKPQSQKEIDDIMESQFHGIFYYSLFVPGIFDVVATATTEPNVPETGTVETPPEVPTVEAEAPADFEPLAHFEPFDDNEVVNEVNAIEDKAQLKLIIESHGAEAPSNRSGIPKFQAVAAEAVLNSRTTEETLTEPETETVAEL